MTFATARDLVALFAAQAREQNALLLTLRDAAAVDFDEAKTMVGKVMGETWLAALAPLLREHPSLTPPEMVGQRS